MTNDFKKPGKAVDWIQAVKEAHVPDGPDASVEAY
jgi:hypothetical protein